MAVREPPRSVPSVTAGVSGPVDRTSTNEQPNETPGITSPSALKVLGAVGGQITLLTALLFYFGWARTAAEAQYLGFDASALQLSTTDYVLRSVGTLFLPLFLLTAIVLGVQIAHPHILSWCHNRTDRFLPWLRVAIPLILVTFPLAAWGATRLAPQWWQPVMPLSVTIAVVLCLYITLLVRDLPRRGSASPADAALQRAGANKREPQPWWLTLQGTLAIALVVLCLFWTIGRFATVEGHSMAANFVSSIRQQNAATVTVLSKYDLRIGGLGVHTTRFGDGGTFRFEYQGLVLFIRSGGNFFLLPLGWTYEHPRVIVIPDNDEVRIYYVRLHSSKARVTATTPKNIHNHAGISCHCARVFSWARFLWNTGNLHVCRINMHGVITTVFAHFDTHQW